MTSGPGFDPHPQFQAGEAGESVWFRRTDRPLVGTVEQIRYQVGMGFRYRVRVSPMAVLWLDEGELHLHEREG